MITLTESLALKPGQRFIFCPFGDIHWDTREAERTRFRRLIRWAVEQQAGGAVVRFIGTGDNQDYMSPSERHSLAGSKLHETSMARLDGDNTKSVGDFEAVLRPIAPMLVGLMTGHHVYRFFEPVDGCVDTDQLLAKRLKTRYLGDGVCIVTFEFPHALTLKIAVAHGYGNSRTEGAKVAKRIAFGSRVAPDADVVYMAHDNSKFAFSTEDAYGNKRTYCGVGGYQRGYLQGPRAGYVEKFLMPPASVGVVPLFVHIEKRNNIWRVDHHASV